MLTASSIADLRAPGSGVLEIQYRNGTYYGLTRHDLCGLLTGDVDMFRLVKPQILTSTPVVVPHDFCGLTIENCGLGDGLSQMPALRYGTFRMLGFGSYWAEIDQPGGYVFTRFDAAVALARAASKRIVLNIAYTPTHRASNLNAHRSAGASTAGWPSPPADLAATLQTYPAINSPSFAAFVRALLSRYGGCPDFTFVNGNEPHYRMWSTLYQPNAPVFNHWSPTDTAPTDLTTPRTSAVGDVQRFDKLVQLGADLFGIVTHEGAPGALVLAPDFFGETSSQDIGGKQDGITCFTQYLADGGGEVCHGFALHGYMNEWKGILGASLRLKAQIDGYRQAAAAAGYGAKPWYDTEFGHNVMGDLPLEDQRLWLRRQMWLKACMGFKLSSLYVYDSQNPETSVMSLHSRVNGLSPLAPSFDEIAGILPGSTITAGMFAPWSGSVYATCNGVHYADGVPLA